jgi:hypothetical protein
MSWLTVSRRVILPILLAAAVRAQCPNSIVAGPPSTYAGDGQPAVSVWLFQPSALSLELPATYILPTPAITEFVKSRPMG